MQNCYKVAELSINHLGKLLVAREMVDAAKKAGFSAVKAQFIYHEEELYIVRGEEETPEQVMYLYQPMNGFWFPLREYCSEVGIDFGVSVFSKLGARHAQELCPNFIKMAASEVYNLDLFLTIKYPSKPTVVSIPLSIPSELKRYFKEASYYCCAATPYGCEITNLHKEACLELRGLSDHSPRGLHEEEIEALGLLYYERHITVKRDCPDRAFSTLLGG